jgi:hypothetical protein
MTVEKLISGYGYALTFAAVVVVLYGCVELGHRVGLRRRTDDESGKSQITTLEAALLGMLGLLLGFTFAMALSRHDARRGMVLTDANAIGTAYLRAQLLPEPQRSELSDLLREYVDVRLAAARDTSRLAESVARSDEILNEAWGVTSQVARENPSVVPTGLFISSLNDVIDAHAARVKAATDHVPPPVLMVLLCAAGVTSFIMGYGAGLARRKVLIPPLAIVLVITMVMMTVVDLDQPQSGLLKVSQQSMEDLRDSMTVTPEQTASRAVVPDPAADVAPSARRDPE